MEYESALDETLIRLIAGGRSDALGELYDRYGRLIYSVALNTVGEGALAEEITQEVYLQVWKNAATYQAHKGKVVTWMTSIARYRAIDKLRRRKARPETFPLFQYEVEEMEIPLNYELERSVDLKLQQQRVRRAVSELPDNQREVLALAFFKGYTHSEIAEALQIPLGTVKTRIRLAMGKLRVRLVEEAVPADE